MTRQGSWPAHGGEAGATLAWLGVTPPRHWIDLSASLNPLGPPDWVPDWLSANLVELYRYPDGQCRLARQALAEWHGLSEEQVWLTNGGAEAIDLVTRAHRGGRALIVEPTFGEYARSCASSDITVQRISLEGDDFRLPLMSLLERLDDVDLLFLCRPNNPTATCVSRQEIETLLEAARCSDTLVVIDEAFIDFAVDQTPLDDLLAQDYPLVLLRSLTKFYTLAGLRIGYLLAGAERIGRLAAHQSAWSVNGLAAAIVPPLLNDQSFADATRQWVAAEQQRVPVRMREEGLVVPDCQANFVLCRPPGETSVERGEALLRHLAGHGFIGRHTHTFAGLSGGWVRLALSTPATNDALLGVLAEASGGFEGGGRGWGEKA
ncbi:pyridoxal phosphate-dependent aminotransferase [Halomonas cupida]|uniref:L-threonine O-3-phosphate decarboxylase n=1 Tax=Halomonas cupida TaxID=44933 RepID=A0A1M7LAL5_9GAMM|nr:aminotransferase class I/II-fold pyridoxal phosphate-dependent enzyme [Halomonas cupida]GEN25200.1 threonine-phosphate decarboxylase [Halomonas cupida]SHM75095.1 L-threonine O-3-phosphate decarboxylase [Halomonas cupida]